MINKGFISVLFFVFVYFTSVIADTAASTWTTETVDGSGYASSCIYTSTALDTSGKVHISYYDSGSLKYATNASGSWVITTVDSSSNGIVGWYTSIALDTNGKVHISYCYYFYSASTNTYNRYLKYATNASGAWVTTTVDNSGGAGNHTSIAIDSSGKVHISYSDLRVYYLKYATNASGAWVITSVDRCGSPGGGWTSIALDTNDKVHIGYYDGTNADLKYTTNSNGSWVMTTVDSTGEVGIGEISLALDASDKAHISYYDYTNARLKYATNASGSWITATLENGGYTSSLALDSSGKVSIIYGTYPSLKYTTNASGSWITEIVDSSGYGCTVWGRSLVFDNSGKIHMSYSLGTDNVGVDHDLKYATKLPITTGAPVVITSSATDVTSDHATLNGTIDANGLSTTAWFQYSTISGLYDYSTATQDVTGTSTSISADISGLTASTTYYYRIAAQNSSGTSYGSETTFITAASNVAPVANAGNDQTVCVGDTVTLDASGSSDADGDPITYSWAFTSVPSGSTAALSSSTTVNPTFVVDETGTYVVQLVVNDGTVDSDPVTIQIQAITKEEMAVVVVQNIRDQVTSFDASVFKNGNMRNALVNKIDAVVASIEAGDYAGALGQLERDILRKTDGCVDSAEPDRNDWITDCEFQEIFYQLIQDAIAEVRDLME